jgi:hypothetical protein
MSLLNANMTPFSDNIITLTNNIISQPHHNQIIMEEQSFMKGGAKSKKKQIDTYTKVELVKIAKKNEVSLKTPQKEVKTKLQLFESLKRKKLI